MRKVRTFSHDTELVKQRRNHIVKVATELIARKGYNNISTRELALALGMSTGGLYHYIGSKQDILYLIINFTSDLTGQSLSRFDASMANKSPAEQLGQSIRTYLDIVDSYRDFHNFVNHIMLSLTLSERRIVYEAESRVVDYFEQLIQSGVEKGEFVTEDARIVAHNIVAVANAWANRGWYLKKYYNLDQYTELQIRQVLLQLNGHKTEIINTR
jgi:TetR/AcrR family transcriptional regulator, cholesterol catabolism regulator